MLAVLTFVATLFLGIAENPDTYSDTIVKRYILDDNNVTVEQTMEECSVVTGTGWIYDENMGWIYQAEEITVSSKA